MLLSQLPFELETHLKKLLICSIGWNKVRTQCQSRSARARRLKTLHVHRAMKNWDSVLWPGDPFISSMRRIERYIIYGIWRHFVISKWAPASTCIVLIVVFASLKDKILVFMIFFQIFDTLNLISRSGDPAKSACRTGPDRISQKMPDHRTGPDRISDPVGS